MKKYFDKQENLYGFKIEKQKVSESSFISVKNVFPHYPSTQEIYKIIESLKEYIKKEKGEEAGYPMLHVEKIGATAFEAMVAIPTKTILASKDSFQLKQMVLGGAILMAEVNGGIEKVKNGEPHKFENVKWFTFESLPPKEKLHSGLMPFLNQHKINLFK